MMNEEILSRLRKRDMPVDEWLPLFSQALTEIYTLPDAFQRIVLTAYYLNGLTLSEIAKRLELTPRSVRRIKAKALAALSR